MKFGKSYAVTIASVPEQWRAGAIEYRKLKKVINAVSAELSELGLTSKVLQDLLESRDEDVNSVQVAREEVAGPSNAGDEKGGDAKATVRAVGEQEEVEIGAGIVDGVGMVNGAAEVPALSEKARGKRKARGRGARASYELSGIPEAPQPRIRIIFSSESSNSASDYDSDLETFRSQLLLRQQQSSATSPETLSTNPSSDPSSEDRFVEVNSSEDDLAKANVERESADSADSNDDDAAIFGAARPKERHLLKRMYGVHVEGHRESGESEEESAKANEWLGMDSTRLFEDDEEDARIPLRRRKSDDTVRWVEGTLGKLGTSIATAASEQSKSSASTEDGGVDADDDEESPPGQNVPLKKSRHRHRRHRREVFIPLNYDSEFLSLLAQALNSLAALQLVQKSTFVASIAVLAEEVSHVSSPSRNRNDLAEWREIFALWVEAQIFESGRESDRGERTVEGAEEKLEWFVGQVGTRGLAKRMRHKKSRLALEKFIGLNVELLDMKRFQMVNEEAARKILKKHDKRTALTATLGFPQFIAAATSISPDGINSTVSRALHLPGFPSLPHILLATFTSTLLPIIPSLDDYECSICSEVSYKPIRLDCGHKFCVRCLVKMQKRGQDACPQCRAPVVLRANATNLDSALQAYLRLWFPKEVKRKLKSDSVEVAKEEVAAMQNSDRCCIQ